jgi:hypothetical protein
MDYEQMIQWFWNNRGNREALQKAYLNPNWQWMWVEIGDLLSALGDLEDEYNALVGIETVIRERQEEIRRI